MGEKDFCVSPHVTKNNLKHLIKEEEEKRKPSCNLEKLKDMTALINLAWQPCAGMYDLTLGIFFGIPTTMGDITKLSILDSVEGKIK